jgi:hypothetical protein
MSSNIQEFGDFYVVDNLDDAAQIFSDKNNKKYLWAISGKSSFKVRDMAEAEEFFKDPAVFVSLRNERPSSRIKRPPPTPVITAADDIKKPKQAPGEPCPLCLGSKHYISQSTKELWAYEVRALGKRVTSSVCVECNGRGIV